MYFCESFEYKCLSAAISNMVVRLLRHYDQDERERDGAVHGHTMSPKLLRAFGHQGARNFSEKDWLKHIHEGSNKMRFEHCESSRNALVFFLANQGHTGGQMIAPGKRKQRGKTYHLLHNLSHLLEDIQMKKNRAMISRDQEKCTMSVVWNIFRTPSVG